MCLFPTSLCGVLVFNSVSRVPPASSSRLLSHTIFHIQLCQPPSFPYNFVTHHPSHTTLSHAIFHTQLCHTIFHSQLCHTHHLSHTTLSQAIFHIQLCHTASFTHNFVTHIFHTQLCQPPSFPYNFVTHTIFHTQLCQPPFFPYNFVTHHLSHTTLSHTIFHIQLCHTPSFTHNFVNHHFSHTTLSHTIVSRGRRGRRGRRGTHGTGWRAWTDLVTPVMPRHFASQVWHNLTSTFVLRGRRGTISHPPSFRVAGVALMALGGALGLAWSPVKPVTPRHFAWQAWHNLTSTFVLRGRRGTISHPPLFRVAGVALMALGGALGLAWSSTIVSRGRRGTHGTGWTGLVARDARDARDSAALCVAGVAQPHIHLRCRGRRGTISHPPSFRVASVPLMAMGGALGLAWSPVTPVMPRHFAWQVWHNLTSTFVLRGRRGTISHPPSFRVAGVPLMALGGALGLAW